MLHLNRKAEIQILCGSTSGPSQSLSNIFGMGTDVGGAGGGAGIGGGMGLVEYIVEKIRMTG